MFELVPFVIAVVAALLGATVGLLLGKPFGRFRGVVAAVVILVAMSSAMYRPLTDGVSLSLGFVTRADLVLRDAAERLAETAAIRRQLRFTNESEGAQLVAELGLRGIQYLDAEDIAAWARYQLKLSEQSPVICAANWNGGGDPNEFVRVFRSFSDDDAANWARIATTAAIRAAEADKHTQGADPAMYDAGIAEILEHLPSDRREHFEANLGQELPSAQACELFKTLITASFDLGPELRTGFWRALYGAATPE